MGGADRELHGLMQAIGQAARAAAASLAVMTPQQKDAGLLAAAKALRASVPTILAANALDVQDAEQRGTSGSFLDRLRLDTARLEAIAQAVEDIAALPDPVGRVLAQWTQPNGLMFERVATPLGVIGVIFESRPNVTADAGALCLKSGNAAILRAGSESFRSASAIADAMRAGLQQAGIPADAIQLVPSKDRAAVGLMLQGLDQNIDVIVPRGGRSLVERVQAEARVPVFAHLEGLCHIYIDRAADLDMAKAIVRNAKLRRTGVCGAAETLLIDRACLNSHARELVTMLIGEGCEVRGDTGIAAIDPRVVPAVEQDWHTEYL
ncbi:MAG: glutamate-5-semialdehyde dehydrogenase, partial [Beijerinckiaceae bacterium]